MVTTKKILNGSIISNALLAGVFVAFFSLCYLIIRNASLQDAHLVQMFVVAIIYLVLFALWKISILARAGFITIKQRHDRKPDTVFLSTYLQAEKRPPRFFL